MSVFRSIVFSAALAGLVVGGVVTLVQHLLTTPLILQAEQYESAGAAPPAAHEHAGADHAAHEHGEAAWQPRDGLERTLYTAGANVLNTTGFALMLLAFYTLRGGRIGWRQGLLWGLAGFAAFSLAPALGLPPQLPGAAETPLGPRQLWWVATAAATLGGLGLVGLLRTPLAIVAGLALIALPHLIGAPQLAEAGSSVPLALSRQFVLAALATSFVSWVMLGWLTGLLHARSA
ncbi:CbtA family protein [Alsobacter sp. SYSU M60028]|uniref:CbtA family protein n=1 Tax=Alsobacter ponti TaxID=2962936 RepID=A0ABT1LAB7_9HYPH|nr:CbtA family protein [Alsobacter ponti]MCP8938051.1 CbtA family protein [Alsobacter ponti]